MGKLVESAPGTKTFEDAIKEIDEVKEPEKSEPQNPENPTPPETPETPATPEAPTTPETPEKKKEGEDTPTEEGEKKKEGGDVEPPAPVVLPEEFKTVFPEAQTPADIISTYQAIKDALKESEDANSGFIAVIDRAKDDLAPLLKAISEGKDFISALRTLDKIEERLQPPEFENKEEYDKYMREQIENEQKRNKEIEEAKRKAKIAEEAKAHAIKLREKFVQGKNLSPEQAKGFFEFMQSLFNGDPRTGKLPEDTYEKLYIAYTHVDEIAKVRSEEEKKRQQAVIDAKNKGIEEARKAKGKKGDGLPHLSQGGPTPASNPTQSLIDSFQTPSRLTVKELN